MNRIPLLEGEEVYKLIPQRNPIVMVDTFFCADEGGAETGLHVQSGNIFCQGDVLSEPGLIEHVAQSAAAFAGYPHQCNEDIALMRAIPGMTVINPADAVEARAAVEAALHFKGPVYLRFGRYAVPVFNDKATYKFELGKGVQLREGTDVTIIATGIMVDMANTAADMLKAEGVSARVINIHTIKPLDREIVLKAAKETGAIVTAEEHSIIGGLGAAVAETVCEGYPVPVVRVGVNDTFGRSGSVPDLLEAFGLTPANIVKKAKEAIALKK